MDVTNKPRKPLSLPLPGGEKLFLGAEKTGRVTAKAFAHLPIAKLIEAGDVESADGVTRQKDSSGSNSAPTPGSRHRGSITMRQCGDR